MPSPNRFIWRIFWLFFLCAIGCAGISMARAYETYEPYYEWDLSSSSFTERRAKEDFTKLDQLKSHFRRRKNVRTDCTRRELAELLRREVELALITRALPPTAPKPPIKKPSKDTPPAPKPPIKKPLKKPAKEKVATADSCETILEDLRKKRKNSPPLPGGGWLHSLSNAQQECLKLDIKKRQEVQDERTSNEKLLRQAAAKGKQAVDVGKLEAVMEKEEKICGPIVKAYVELTKKPGVGYPTKSSEQQSAFTIMFYIDAIKKDKRI